MAKHPTSRSGSNGRLSYRPAPDEGPIPKTLELIRTQLPVWRDDPTRPAVASEKRLNSSLCDFLDCRAREACPMVRFKHEDPQSDSATVDLGVHGTEEITFIGTSGYSIYEPFMVIECKRMPAPKNGREREYVTGISRASGSPTGGIQRFKLGLHGGKVAIAAIVGYIEKENSHHWLSAINQWITELAAKTITDGCVWSEDDRLQDLVCDEMKGTSTAFSTHARNESLTPTFISLHHFWVVMKVENL